MNVVCAREIRGQQRNQRLDADQRQRQAERAAQEGDQQALGEQLANDARRGAPKARRTEISRCRAEALASSRLAALAQAISSTMPTAPSRTRSNRRLDPTISLSSGMTSTFQPRSSGMLATQLRHERVHLARRLLDGDIRSSAARCPRCNALRAATDRPQR